MIRFTGVTRAFGGRTVVDGFSATVPDGGVLVLTGPNGSGKSTLVKLTLGLCAPDAGTIEGVAGRRLAAVFQEDRLCEQLGAIGNVRVALSRRVTNDEIVAELHAAGLPDTALGAPVRQLSGGERRRVCLVRAMMAQADVVCLDEPFTGLDATLDAAIAYVRERIAGRDTILVTHSPAEAAAFGGQVVGLG